MEKVFRLFIASALILLTGVAVARHARKEPLAIGSSVPAKGFAVVELFTSEGCSSCPPADAVLARIAVAYPEHVLVLGFHVDYWNNLGWEDPYSKVAFSERQRYYAKALGTDGVYTPQAIVNGTVGMVGSEQRKIETLIDNAIEKEVNQPIEIDAALSRDQHTIIVSYKFAGTSGTVLNIALVQRNASTNVKAGENGGHKLTHINLVRDFKTVINKEGTVQLAIPNTLSAPGCGIAAYIQDERTMQILGTTMLTSIH